MSKLSIKSFYRKKVWYNKLVDMIIQTYHVIFFFQTIDDILTLITI